MRLKPLAKFILFALIVGGAYAAWQYAPARYKSADLREYGSKVRSLVRKIKPAPRPPVESPPPVVVTLNSLVYAGLPPAALMALSAEDGKPVPAQRLPSPLAALEAVRTGKATSAVVDFPSVVYAAQSDQAPFRVVLLVGWRTGSDIIVFRGNSAMKDGDRLAYLKGTSGEYLARRYIGGPLPPALKQSLEKGLTPLPSLEGADKVADALAGRVDTLPPASLSWKARYIPGDERSDQLRPDERIPDVLVVSEAWAQDAPDELTALVRRWLQAQNGLDWDGAGPGRYITEYGKDSGIPETDLRVQMAPASLADQTAFVGIGVERPFWTALAARQALVTARSTATAVEAAAVPVDPRPIKSALSETPSAGKP